MATPNETMRARRHALGLTMSDVASRSSLTIDEYADIEDHEGEARSVVHVRDLKRVCEVLNLDLLELMGIECPFCEQRSALVARSPRNELVQAQRRALGISEEELGDRVGFEKSAIQDLEADPDYLDGWSLSLVVRLAAELDLPPQRLLGVKCRSCGQ